MRLRDRIDGAYRRACSAAKYFAAMFPLGDFFGAIALAAHRRRVGVLRRGWGLDTGKVVVFMFLINLLLSPIGELSEILDQTQTAISGWRKVLAVLDVPIDVAEPVDGVQLAHGALGVEVSHIEFAYRGDGPVLHDVSVDITAGAHVAIVGETGSGKTTFAKLLCRLADPTRGEVRIGDTDLRDVDPASRRHAIRMVPQDGFLFDSTIAENVRMADPAATDDDIDAPSRDSDSIGGCCGCPTASRRWWASAASRCRSANVSSWRWHAPSWATRACSCSTKRRARSMPKPSGLWPTRWRACRAAERRSASPTGSPPPSTPIGPRVRRGPHRRVRKSRRARCRGRVLRALYGSWTANTRTA